MRIAAKRRSEWLLGNRFVDDLQRTTDAERTTPRNVVSLGKGEPIVLVPGLAGSWNLLVPLARRLAKRHRVVMPSLRGDRGVLGLDPARDMSDLADDLAATIDALGLERPTVMGVSFGGAVALEYAVNHPNRIGGLAIYGAEAKFRPTLGTTIARYALERFPLPDDNRFLNQFFNLLHGGKPEPGPLVDFIVDRCWRTDQCVVAHRLGLLESFDVSDHLWRIDVPTLVMAGTRDVVIPASRQKSLAKAIAGASFAQIDGAGHVGFLTHRAQVADHLAALVGKVRQPH